MSSWVALGSDPAPGGAPEARLRAGALLAVLGGLPATAAVLADLPEGAVEMRPPQGSFWPGTPPERSSGLSLLGGRDVGLALRHRRRRHVVTHLLPGPLPPAAGPLVLRLDWSGAGTDSPAGRWSLSLADAGGRLLVPPATGGGALAPDALGAWALCRPGGHRLAHSALGALGLRQAARTRPAPEDLGWSAAAVSASTPVATPRGARPLGTLVAGDAVLDIRGRAVRLAALHLAELPPGFPFSPLRLRALRLPVTRDLLAGPMSCLAVEGDAVHRLTGRGRAVLRAGHLPDPVARPVGGPLRSLLMAVPVPERAAILAPGGLQMVCPGPEGALPADWPELSRSATVTLLDDAAPPIRHSA